MTRILRLAGAATVVSVGLVLAGHGSPPASASGSGSGSGGISLVAQSSWIDHEGTFKLRMRVDAPDPVHDQVQVLIFPGLSTRTDFANAAVGKYSSLTSCCGAAPVDKLPRTSSGGFEVDIPVNQTPPAKSPYSEFTSKLATPVYPVEVSLVDGSGAVIGQPIYTFLVCAAGAPAVTGYPRLSVAVVLPISSRPVIGKGAALEPLGSAESTRLGGVVSALAAHPSVPVTVNASPQTLRTLSAGQAAGNSTDADTLAALATLAQGGNIQVLPSTYAPVSLGDLQSSGLQGEITEQLKSGSTVLSNYLQVTPPPTAWAVDGPLDSSTLGTLTAQGATQLVVPDGDLTPLPAEATFFGYFPYPTRLDGGPSVFAADPGLTADTTRASSPVLAASQLLADLAMLQSIQPGTPHQGVIVLPPPAWTADPTFVSTLVGGLSNNPLLKAVTVKDLFGLVPAAPDVTRGLAPPGPSVADSSIGNDSGAILAARHSIDALTTVFSHEQALAASLQSQLLTAESTAVSEGDRLALLGAIADATGKVLHQVTLAPESSITLTSTHGQIPLTLLSSPSLTAVVQLRLTSPRLLFQAFSPPGGHCQIASGGTGEVCTLTLSTQNTTLKVPVQARSSGVFPLDIQLWSPDGGQRLGPAISDTVRSTAVSGVGVVLIILAVVSLAIWWARDLHHGRRARRLVPSPIDLTFEDPMDEFFREPPETAR